MLASAGPTMPTDDPPPTGLTGRPCPICRAPARAETRPFCSRRCANIDLLRWLGGSYRVPTDETPDGEPPGPGDRDR